MTYLDNLAECYPAILFSLCVWREARGESAAAQNAVAWSIRNRVLRPSWWGNDWISVILKPEQYSSFNPGDANVSKFPQPANRADYAAYLSICVLVESVIQGHGADPVSGATHYYDKSLDDNPPYWSKDGSMTHVSDVGNLRFWKTA